MENDAAGEFVPARAMEVVADFLTAAVNPATVRAEAGHFPETLVALGDSLWAALASSLKHPDSARRILAAFMLLRLDKNSPDDHSKETFLEQARAVILEALRQDEFMPRLWACVRLSNGPVPDEAIPLLIEIVHQSDVALSVYSAAALSHCGEAAAHGLSVLTKALYLNDDVLAVVAGEALARLQIRNEETVLAMVRRLEDVEAPHQYGVLLALRAIGKPAKAAAPTLNRIASDTTAANIYRAAAAEALGSVCPNDMVVRKQLVSLLDGSNWEVLDAALRGLRRSGGLPKVAVSRLRTLLGSDDSAIRRAVARGIKLFPTETELLLHEVIAAMCKESDRETSVELARACAAHGRKAVSPLCDIIRSKNIQYVNAASTALMMLGRDAADEVAVSLLSDSDEATRFTGLSILRGLWPDSESAIPAMAALLPMLNEDQAMHLLSTFAGWRERAIAAVPAVVDCLLGRNGETAEMAETVLVAFGNSAASYLERKLFDSTHDARRRIDHALARIRPSAQRAFDKLLTANVDKDLLLFVFVGEIMENAGPIGLRKISGELELLEPVMLMGLPTSEAALREMLGELNGRLKVSLTQRTTKGSFLTSEGRGLLKEAREYLTWRGYTLVAQNRVD